MLKTREQEWLTPRSREMGLFTDLTLYAEALEIALEEGWVNTYSLQRELRPMLEKI
jgi:hypothetical protein